MEKLDKVIAGLQNCSYPSENCYYSDCPYRGRRDADKVCQDFLLEDALEVINRLKRQLKYARAERDAATARMARLIGQAEARWIELGEKPMPNDWGECPPEFPREGM